MSKASEYAALVEKNEALRQAAWVKALAIPAFNEIENDDGKGEKCAFWFEVSDEGGLRFAIFQDDLHIPFLVPNTADALRLRDWLTETFDEVGE